MVCSVGFLFVDWFTFSTFLRIAEENTVFPCNIVNFSLAFYTGLYMLNLGMKEAVVYGIEVAK